MGGHRQVEVAGRLERLLLGELRIAGDVEGKLQAQHVIARSESALDELPEFSAVRPLPRRAEQVAIGQDEPSRHGLQRVDGGVAVIDRLQPV